jgi:hypothetical protein
MVHSLSHLHSCAALSPDERLDQFIFHAHVSDGTSIPSSHKAIVEKDPDFESILSLAGCYPISSRKPFSIPPNMRGCLQELHYGQLLNHRIPPSMLHVVTRLSLVILSTLMFLLSMMVLLPLLYLSARHPGYGHPWYQIRPAICEQLGRLYHSTWSALQDH